MTTPWDLATVPWRAGRSVGRTIYACPPGSSYRHGEGLIGVMDTPELAAHVVEAHNALIERRMEYLRALVADQAEDEGLWFIAQTAPEAYLQEALRRLHAAIEEAELIDGQDGA